MKKLVYFSLILIVFALSACQSSGPSTKLNVEMTDFAFTPNHFTVPAGKEITVNIAHHGSVVHEFIIMKRGTNAGESFDEDDEPNVYELVKVSPGHSQSFTFTAPAEPGDYQVVCGIVGHIQSGMTAILTVVE
jgi:uncharacterized cupredoxin-like copper-binding protein